MFTKLAHNANRQREKGDKMLKQLIIILLILNSFAFASDEVSLEYKEKKSSSKFFKQHIKIFKNFHLDLHVFSMFSLVDDRFENEYESYIKDRHNEEQKLFTLTYKF